VAHRTILWLVALAAVAAMFSTMLSSGATPLPRSLRPVSSSDRNALSVLIAPDATPATVLAYQPLSYNDDPAAASQPHLAQRASSIAPQTVPLDTSSPPKPVAPSAPQRVPENATQPAAPVPPAHPGRTTGRLQSVDCRLGRLRVRETHESAVFSATSATAIYAGTEPLAEFCALTRFVGTQAIVWWVTSGPQRVASRIDVVPLFGRRVVTSGPDQQGTHPALDETRVVVSATTGSDDPPPTAADPPNDPPGSFSAAPEATIDGVVTARTSNALLVVTSTGARPVVLGPGVGVSGIRNSLSGIAPLDVVSASGIATTTGTLVAARIDVVGRVINEVTGYVTAIGPGVIVLNGSLVVTIGSHSAIVLSNRLVPFSGVAVGQTVSVGLATGSVAVSAATSATAGSTGIGVGSSGAAAPAGTGVSGSATLSSNAAGVSGGASAGANANPAGGGVSSNAGAGANINTSGGGGASANAGAGANVNTSGGGGVSANAGVGGNVNATGNAGSPGNGNGAGNVNASANAGVSGNAGSSGNVSGPANASASGSAAASGTTNTPANANASANANTSAGTGTHGAGASVSAGASAGVGTGNGGPSLNLGVSGSVGLSGGGVSGNAGASGGHDPTTQK
jgi:hypothetical protein